MCSESLCGFRLRNTTKVFQGGYLDVGLLLAYINLSEMKSLSLYLKIKYETSYTLKFIVRKEIFLRPCYSA